MAVLTKAASNLLKWLNIYNISATTYDYNITYKYRHAQRRGVFKTALAELITEGY